MKITELFERGEFVVSAEVGPPKGFHVEHLLEDAKKYLDMGFYLSFAGPLTFKNAHKLQQVAAYVPMDRVLCETDSPYLTPVPKRGQRNDPSNVALVIRQLAQCKGIEPEEAARHTMENGKAVFAIEE